jgi:hypothetical protein
MTWRAYLETDNVTLKPENTKGWKVKKAFDAVAKAFKN